MTHTLFFALKHRLCTYNQCFKQTFEKYCNFSSENLYFTAVQVVQFLHVYLCVMYKTDILMTRHVLQSTKSAITLNIIMFVAYIFRIFWRDEYAQSKSRTETSTISRN